MLRAPTCRMSAYSQTSATSVGVITSVTTASPVSVARLRQQLQPLLAHARESHTARWRACTRRRAGSSRRPQPPPAPPSSNCSSLSTVQGPAIITTSRRRHGHRPRRSYAHDGGLGMELAAGELVGLGDAQDRLDAGKAPPVFAQFGVILQPGVGTPVGPTGPRTPITVRSTPRERWGVNPRSRRARISPTLLRPSRWSA